MRRRPQAIDLASLSRHAAEVEANGPSSAAGFIIIAVFAGFILLAMVIGWAVSAVLR